MNQGIDFDYQLVTAEAMAHFKYIFSGKQVGGVTKGCAMTYNTTTITVAAGFLIVYGRQVKISGTETISIPDVSSGTDYCRLVYEVDLSKTNTEEDFLQGYFKLLQSYDSYPALTQQNLDENPTSGVFQLPFAKFTVDVNGVSNWVDERNSFEVWLTGTLTAGATTLTINSPSILTTSLLDPYVETLSDGTIVAPEKMLVANGSVTFTFDAQSENLGVKVRVI